jgi:hypothetical protein
MLVNPERGEMLLEVKGAKVILCAEMPRLAAFSAKLGKPPLQKIFDLVNNAEVETLYNDFLDCFIIDGDVGALKSKIVDYNDLGKVQAAAIKVLEAFVPKDASKKE